MTSIYTISYAYPTSPRAASVGRAVSGAWVLDQNGALTPFKTEQDAVSAAQGSPSYWSTDGAWKSALVLR